MTAGTLKCDHLLNIIHGSEFLTSHRRLTRSESVDRDKKNRAACGSHVTHLAVRPRFRCRYTERVCRMCQSGPSVDDVLCFFVLVHPVLYSSASSICDITSCISATRRRRSSANQNCRIMLD